MNDKEKILIQQQKTAEALRILDEILDIIRFKDDPEDTIIDQKLEEIKKILEKWSFLIKLGFLFVKTYHIKCIWNNL